MPNLQYVSNLVLDPGTTAYTATANSNAVGCVNASSASLFVTTTALGGTASPTFVVQLQTKDANGNWNNVGNSISVTANGTSTPVLNITGPFGTQLRANVTVTGTNPTANLAIAVAVVYSPQ